MRHAVRFMYEFLLSVLTSSPRPQAHPPQLAPLSALCVLQVWIHLLSEWRQKAVFLGFVTWLFAWEECVGRGRVLVLLAVLHIYFLNKSAVAACTSCPAGGWLFVVATRDSLFHA